MGAAQKSKITEILPLVIFLTVIGTLLYVLLNGIGPEWLRVIIMFVLVGAVLVIAGIGLRAHLRDLETEDV